MLKDLREKINISIQESMDVNFVIIDFFNTVSKIDLPYIVMQQIETDGQVFKKNYNNYETSNVLSVQFDSLSNDMDEAHNNAKLLRMYLDDMTNTLADKGYHSLPEFLSTVTNVSSLEHDKTMFRFTFDATFYFEDNISLKVI